MILQGIFEGVIGSYSMGDVCKPERAAFQKAIDICGADPKNIVMFEDSFKNLRTAKELGMASLLFSLSNASIHGWQETNILDTISVIVFARRRDRGSTF